MIVFKIIKNLIGIRNYTDEFSRCEFIEICRFEDGNDTFICVVRNKDAGEPHIQIYKNKIDWFHYYTSVLLIDNYYFRYSDVFEYEIWRLFGRCKKLSKRQCEKLHEALSKPCYYGKSNWYRALKSYHLNNTGIDISKYDSYYEIPNYSKMYKRLIVDYWARLGEFLVKGWDA